MRGKKSFTNEQARLKDLECGIIRKDTYIKCSVLHTYICPKCGFDWLVKPHSIWTKNSKSCCGPKLTANDDFFNVIGSEQAYILGFLITDGHIEKDRPRIIINLSDKDKKHLEDIRDIISPKSIISIPTWKKTTKEYNGCTLGFTSDKIYNYLKKIGFTHNKTGNEPNLFPIIPKEYHWDYLRGIIDGDGGIYYGIYNRRKNNKVFKSIRIQISSLSKRFLEEIKEFIGFGSINFSRGCFNYYTTKHKHIVDIGDKIYYKSNLIKIERKYNKYLEVKSLFV